MAVEPSLLDGPGQLPDDLREDAARALQKVGAFLGSGGDPRVMESFKDPPGFMALVFVTAGLFIVLWILAEIGNYYEIRNNWAHYQCMPSIAPFAKFYGHDLKETMNYCIGKQVKEHAGGVVAPIYKGVAEVQQVVDGVFTKVEAVEGGIVGLLKGFENFVVNFMNSFRMLGTRVRMSFIRIKEIFQRVYGIFISFTFAAISAITFGENLVCNPLVTFVATIAGVDICCFAPETRICMESGEARRIDELQIGDRLKDGNSVTATFVFDGTGVDMVSVEGVHVSTNHSVRGPNGSWIPAGSWPGAVPVPSRPRIYCLTTTTNTIPVVGGLEFTDYEETSDAGVAEDAQHAAEMALNGYAEADSVGDFALGLDPSLSVLCEYGEWKRMADICIGDTLASGARVTGVVREYCRDIRVTRGGIRVSAAQLMRGLRGGRWFRAGNRFSLQANSGVLCQLFISTNDAITVANDCELWTVRDYQEWHGPETQAPYDAHLQQPKVDPPQRPGTPYPDDEDALLNPLLLAPRSFS